MKIVVLEDELLIANRIKTLCKKIDPKITTVTILTSVSEAIDWFRVNNEPDIFFTDIKLKDGTCFDLFEIINISCYVTFVTAHSEYALDAFKVNCLDYILKPIKENKLQNTLDKYEKLTKDYRNNKSIMKMIKDYEYNQNIKRRFLVKIGKNFKSIPTEDIAYFYIENKITYIVRPDSFKAYVDYTLEEIETQIDHNNFFRVNRQIIVSYKSIIDIQPYFNSRLIIKITPSSPFRKDFIVSRYKVSDFKIWLDR